MYFIEIQDTDWDDYPVGLPTKIGPFLDRDRAEEFIEESPQFYYQVIFKGYLEPKFRGRFGSHTVRIKSLTDDLRKPEDFL